MSDTQKPRIVGIYPSRTGKQARWEVKYVGLDGKKHSKYRKDKREANALAKQIETTLCNEVGAAASSTDMDWYAFLVRIAHAAEASGDWSAAIAATKASITFMPPPEPVKEVNLSNLPKAELIAAMVEGLEAEGYKVERRLKVVEDGP